MTLKTKVNSVVSYIEKEKKKKTWGGRKRRCRRFWISFSREKVSSFSLKYRAIRPSDVFETRRRTALRGEGFAWVLDLGSFLKLREVGVSPYLGLFFV